MWLTNLDRDENRYTHGGNLKPPARSLVGEWVKISWQAVLVEMVKYFFLSCAITTNIDGSDDHNIHCFKPGQPCEAGRMLLEAETQNLLTTSEANQLNHNPFASDSDGEETEKNEALIEEEDEEEADESESEDDV